MRTSRRTKSTKLLLSKSKQRPKSIYKIWNEMTQILNNQKLEEKSLPVWGCDREDERQWENWLVYKAFHLEGSVRSCLPSPMKQPHSSFSSAPLLPNPCSTPTPLSHSSLFKAPLEIYVLFSHTQWHVVVLETRRWKKEKMGTKKIVNWKGFRGFFHFIPIWEGWELEFRFVGSIGSIGSNQCILVHFSIK